MRNLHNTVVIFNNYHTAHTSKSSLKTTLRLSDSNNRYKCQLAPNV
jgi:hypothetical protein